MRLLGARTHDADKATTTNMLQTAAMLKPEIMTSVMNLFEGNVSTFGSFLGRKGLTSQGLYAGLDTKTFKVVGNRKVMWTINGSHLRKGVILSHTGGATPGVANSEFSIVVSTDFFSKNDVLELVDRRTLLVVLGKEPSASNTWTYRVKVMDNSSTSFCDPTLLDGKEIGFGHTSFPELSEDAGEKTTYPEWHTEFLGIQRMKHTISGSAKASKIWIEHNGQKMWTYSQNLEMLRRWAESMEHQLLFGRATIDANDRHYVHDDIGRPLPMGNGIINQGDPALKMQYNTLTIRLLERMMDNFALQANNDGVTEVAVCCGRTFHGNFQRLMRDVLQQNPVPLYEKTADGAGIRTAFSWYEFNGVRFYLMNCPAFDSPYRPIERDQYGNNNMSERAFFVSLGNTVGGNSNVELITLGNEEEDRRFVQKVITGMAGDGPMVQGASNKYMAQMASSPVDGMQVHILAESGAILRNPLGFAEMTKTRRP